MLAIIVRRIWIKSTTEEHLQACFASIPYAKSVVAAVESHPPVKIASMLACRIVVGGNMPPSRDSR